MNTKRIQSGVRKKRIVTWNLKTREKLRFATGVEKTVVGKRSTPDSSPEWKAFRGYHDLTPLSGIIQREKIA